MELTDEITKASDDLIFFINRFGKTFDPRTKDKDLTFTLYPFQEEYALALKDHIENGKDLFVEKSRDMGVSWVTLYVILWFWLFRKNFKVLLGSRKEDYVDSNTIESLFGKLDYALRYIPFKPENFDVKKHRTYMKLISPVTGSTVLGESANANFSRAGRFNCIFFDEMAFWPYQQSSWEAAGDATPCRIGVTTPSEAPSYAKYLRNSGIIEVKTIHWRDHPTKDNEWYEKEKLRRTTDEIARELDINWEGSTAGIVYPEIGLAELGNYPYMPFQPLYNAWDFGLDGTAIQWWQIDPLNGKGRLIDSYQCTDKVIEYVFPAFGQPINSIHSYTQQDIDFFNVISKLPKGVHYGDPDVEKRSIQTGNTTQQLLNDVGVIVQTNTQSNSHEQRKTETKRFLQKGIQINDTPRNRFFLECIRNARYPQRQDTSQATTPIITPIHDWTSHQRTALEYMCVNLSTVPKVKHQQVTYEGGDPITGFGRRRVVKRHDDFF